MDHSTQARLAESLFIVWCAVWWRLRGGALTTLTGWNPGTDGARGMAAIAIALPVVAYEQSLILLLIAPSIFLGLKLTGWEEFQLMGLEAGSVFETEKPGYWMRWLPRILGLRPSTIPYDLVGMAQAGLVCFAPLALFFLALKIVVWRDTPLAAGLMLGVPYLLARLPLPKIPRFSSGSQWGEVFAGALIGWAIWFALS